MICASNYRQKLKAFHCHSIWRHISEAWHCRQNLKAQPNYMTSHHRRVTLLPEFQGSTKVHGVTSQKSDTAASTSRPYQTTWHHIPEEWHCRQYLKALPNYMTSHPRRMTLPPKPLGPTKVHGLTSQKNDTAARTSRPYQTTWRYIPEEWHCRQNIKALPKYMTSHPRRVTLPREPQGTCLPS
jgi:rubredoxin